jgi:hypothetical protein
MMKSISITGCACLVLSVSMALEEVRTYPVKIRGDQQGSLKYCVHKVDNKEVGGKEMLIWIRPDGTEELIFEKALPSGSAFGRPDEAFMKGEKIALLASGPFGLSYERYKRKSGNWSLEAECPLGSFSPDGAGGEFHSLHKYRQFRIEAEPRDFEITDIPLVPEVPASLLRIGLVDGQPHHPRGLHIDGAIWDEPWEKILKDHRERQQKRR